MTIIIKNKETLLFGDFKFKCSAGMKGFAKNKIEGDKKTPRGVFNLGKLYFRKDRNHQPNTKIKCVPIKKNWGWSHDLKNKKHYNKLGPHYCGPKSFIYDEYLSAEEALCPFLFISS